MKLDDDFGGIYASDVKGSLDLYDNEGFGVLPARALDDISGTATRLVTSM